MITQSQATGARVLIIEDEPDMAHLIQLSLIKHGAFVISLAADGASGLRKAREELPDLIILDLMLPRMHGLEVCKALKTHSSTEVIPIVIVSAKSSDRDRITGLEVGAADYVTKPFSPREVALRVSRFLRSGERNPNQEVLKIGTIILDRSRHYAEVRGKELSLPLIEFKLLSRLMQGRGCIQTRDQLLTEVWGYEKAIITRTVDTHVRRLRKKLGKAGDAIETVRSYGYRLRLD